MNKKITILIAFLIACKAPIGNLSPNKISYQDEMRNLVQNISKYTKTLKPSFVVVTQNGYELLKKDGISAINYLSEIDGIAAEGLFYGYNTVDQPNTKMDIDYFDRFLNTNIIGKKPILAIDFCTDPTTINQSMAINLAKNNKLFISSNKKLNELPNPNLVLLGENKNNIEKIADAKNFMVMQSLNNYSKEMIIDNISKSNYDIVIIDGFYQNQLLSDANIKALKTKKNGGKRLVFANLNISKAESKKYYWQPNWLLSLPNFVNKELGNDTFRINYWQTEWQNILFGDENALINRFIKLGFDGVYLRGIEAFEAYQ